ncbi:MAG TPA: NAD(P)/FAD-dependent oxidoreductase [Bradyrhizobium sp.]
MLDKTDDLSVAADAWLVQFEEALARPEDALLDSLFHSDSYWRDVLALSWNIQTVNGADAILKQLKTCAPSAAARGFAINANRQPPRQVTRAGTHSIEAIFKFETAIGRGSGIIRLIPDAADGNRLKAWTLLTELGELKGFEEQIGKERPRGNAYSRDFRGPNWLDLRKASAEYADRDPDVLVVGGGQAGLTIAARLKQLNVDALIVDREKRIGDNWRRRYHALTLHNQVQVNHLPYMPFPPNWPVYIPKDKLANWFEAYAESMELNFWTGTAFERGVYHDAEGRWSVVLRRADGTERTMHPRHIVMATGVSGIPNRPEIAGLENFTGTIMHSSQYEDGEAWNGKKAIVIGTGNSGHDIAQDLHSSGADATLVQRSSTLITNIEPSAQLAYVTYNEGTLEDNDLIASSMPLTLARKSHVLLTEQSKNLDKPLLDGLERVGFKLDFGEDNTGWQFKYLTRGGGYYFNVGCSDLVAAGKIALKQFADIETFAADGARLKNGATIAAELIVLATGYKPQEHLVSQLFGDEVTAQVGPIWGFGEEQELRNMYTRTGQPGLWFIAGSLAQCRINSKYLALQIKAIEQGLLARDVGPHLSW